MEKEDTSMRKIRDICEKYLRKTWKMLEKYMTHILSARKIWEILETISQKFEKMNEKPPPIYDTDFKFLAVALRFWDVRVNTGFFRKDARNEKMNNKINVVGNSVKSNIVLLYCLDVEKECSSHWTTFQSLLEYTVKQCVFLVKTYFLTNWTLNINHIWQEIQSPQTQ